MKHCDIILANMPIAKENTLPLPIFLLKSYLEQSGFSCKTYDLNKLTIGNYIERLPKSTNSFILEDNIFQVKRYYDYYEEIFEPLFINWIEEIKLLNPRWIGLSLVSYETLMPTVTMVRLIKQHMPNVKIVLGGAIFIPYLLNWEAFYIFFDSLKNYGVDAYVCGDGEEAIVELLKGNTDFPGINLADNNSHKDCNFSVASPVEIDLLPSPDYSDMDPNITYDSYYVYSSRGCYNKCSFCIDSQLYKYKYRTAKNIIKDLDSFPFKNKNFFFTDNLMNGNPKEFKKLITGLQDRDYTWSGMYVCNSWMEDKDYKMASDAGLEAIYIGMESGCERVRNDMGKPFSNADIIKTVSLSGRNSIAVVLLNIIGWVTETEEEFQENLDFLKTLFDYGNITHYFCSPLAVTPIQPLYKMYDFTYDKSFNWIYKDNTTEVRLDRMERTRQFCEDNNIIFISV
jgi:radical SAM superfamily enzyme YgiQ (UPF0313 family)